MDLCRLPSLWLRQLLDRLGSEQQVFILRRSAGFAYSFVSLLRSEPSNCKVTLLPLAMRVLLKHIEKGLDDIPLTGAKAGATDRKEETEDESGTDGALFASLERGGSWRISVHALNVIRMILIDAALSPDLDTFIAESTELAVRGFQSRNWAVSSFALFPSFYLFILTASTCRITLHSFDLSHSELPTNLSVAHALISPYPSYSYAF